jgi:hypothetical protein
VSGALRIEGLRSRSSEVLLISFVVVAGLVAGAVGVRDARLGALVVAVLVVLLLVSRRPVVLAVVAVAGVYAVQRLGSTSAAPGSTGGISYSDALVAAASILALPALAATPELRRLRGAAGGIAVYLALLAPGLLANPSMSAFLEWAHRLVMVGGGLLVGAWLVREHAERAALRLLTVVSCVVAIAAIENTLSHDLHAASPFGLNKNFIGAMFAVALVLLLASAESIRVAPAVRFAAVVLIAGGLVASQSRGSQLAAVLGLLVAFVLNPRAHRRRTQVFAGLVAAILAVVAYTSIRDQLNLDRADLNNSSAGVRFNVEAVTLDIWRTSPVVGVGLKYFNTGNYGQYAYAPNNVVDNELAESGLIGLAGFVLFQVGVMWAGIRRRGSPLVAAAVGVVAGQLLHGAVDIYWSSGVVTLPFLILGIALAGPRTPPLAGRSTSRTSVGAHRAG